MTNYLMFADEVKEDVLARSPMSSKLQRTEWVCHIRCDAFGNKKQYPVYYSPVDGKLFKLAYSSHGEANFTRITINYYPFYGLSLKLWRYFSPRIKKREYEASVALTVKAMIEAGHHLPFDVQNRMQEKVFQSVFIAVHNT